MSIQNRLHMILKMHNISASNFADQIGVQRSNVSHILSGRNKPSLDFLEKTLLSFPRVNASWLITGKMPNESIVEEENNIATKLDDSIRNNSIQESINSKEIEKILVFYSDKTFEEYKPNK